MTISGTQNKIAYVSNGIASEFAIPFKFFNNEDVDIYVSSFSQVSRKLVEKKDYVLSGAGNEFGGSVRITAPLENGMRITILRTVPLTQEVDFRENEIFPAKTQERALDKLTMIVQQNAEKLSRTLTLDVTSTENPDQVIPRIFQAEIEAVNAAAEISVRALEAKVAADMASEASERAKNAAQKAVAGNIGDIKWTMRNDVPAGGAWCDGAEYGSAAFPDVWSMLVEGRLPSLSYEDYEAVRSVSGGNCGRFALDVSTEKFRVPTFTSAYMGATGDPAAVGLYEADQIVNITGYIPTDIGTGGIRGAFYSVGGEVPYAGGDGVGIGVGFDASRIVRTGDRVQPETVLMRAYIILYSNVRDGALAQAAELMTALAGKAGCSADNFTASGRQAVTRWTVPNYAAAIDRSSQWGQSLEAPSNGYVWVRGNADAANSGRDRVMFNVGGVSFIVSQNGATQTGAGGGAFFFIQKGAVFCASGGNGYLRQLVFIPCLEG